MFLCPSQVVGRSLSSSDRLAANIARKWVLHNPHVPYRNASRETINASVSTASLLQSRMITTPVAQQGYSTIAHLDILL